MRKAWPALKLRADLNTASLANRVDSVTQSWKGMLNQSSASSPFVFAIFSVDSRSPCVVTSPSVDECLSPGKATCRSLGMGQTH